MAKFDRYDSSNKKRGQHKKQTREGDSFKRIKDSDKGTSRSGLKTYLKNAVKNLRVELD